MHVYMQYCSVCECACERERKSIKRKESSEVDSGCTKIDRGKKREKEREPEKTMKERNRQRCDRYECCMHKGDE